MMGVDSLAERATVSIYRVPYCINVTSVYALVNLDYEEGLYDLFICLRYELSTV